MLSNITQITSLKITFDLHVFQFERFEVARKQAISFILASFILAPNDASLQTNQTHYYTFGMVYLSSRHANMKLRKRFLNGKYYITVDLCI